MPTLTLQPDAAAGVDAYLDRGIPDTNYGAATQLYMRTGGGADRRSLARFDLSGLPIGAVVTAATLYLYNRACYTNATGSVNRILAANSAWTEAGATWNFALGGATRWAGDAGGDGGADAGCSVSGVDYSAVLMGSWTWLTTDAAGLEYAIALNVVEMNAMLAANHGFLLTANANNNNMMYSSDWGAPAVRPKLVVDYTVGGGLLPILQNHGAWQGGTL